MKQIVKKILCGFLALLLALPLNLIGVQAADSLPEERKIGRAADEVTALKSGIVDSTQLNYFSYTAYSGKSWTLNANESYIDLGASDAKANECYYEIHFRGSGIKVYAVKASNHGKVAFTVDGEEGQMVDLYNSSRSEQLVYEVSGLSEGEHVLKAITQTEKSGRSIVNQVSYAEITHQPYKGGIPNLGGTIEDTNTQYTQERYGEISAKSTTSAKLTAWKNDKAVSELVLYSKNCSLENVSIEAGALINGSDTIPADNITATFIKSTKAYNGSYLGYGSKDREVPAATASNRSESSDILYQTTPVDIGWNKLQPVWVEFNIPKDAAAGIYTGTLKATADGIENPIVFNYTVTVQNAVLPDIEEMAGAFDVELWQYPYASAEYYNVTPFSEEHLNIMRSSMLKYKEVGGHAITTTIVEEAWSGQTYSANEVHYPSMVKWTKKADGSFAYDYKDFDAWVNFCKSLGIGDKIVLYSIAPWHNSFTYWEGEELKYESFTSGSDRYREVWTDFLENLIEHLEENEWFDDAYIGIDERGFSTAAFDLVDSVENSNGESLKTAGAMDNFVGKRDLAMRVDDLNIGDNAVVAHADDFAQLLADREAAGLRTTLYSCTEHRPGNFSLSAPMESYWSIVNAGKAGTAGFLRWAYDAWVADPLNDATHNAFEPGDCFLIYPAEKDAADKTCKSSVRLERMAEGVRDVNKLRLIEKEVPELSEEIETLYAGILTTASTGRTYLSAAEKTQLEGEMNAFKEGVARITKKYLKETVDGLYIEESSKELVQDTTWQIPVTLRSDIEDKTVIYKSSDTSVAAVDANGVVTARKPGAVTITAMNKASGYADMVEVTVTKKVMYISNKLTDYKLPEKYLSDVEKHADHEPISESNPNSRLYLGQPDMVMLDDEKTLITVYPVGHGKGSVIMQISYDAGETWIERTQEPVVKDEETGEDLWPSAPVSWKTSYETPTLYKLNMTDGTTKLIMISGRPESFGAPTGGWDTSISEDGGITWSEYQTFCKNFADGTRNETVVAMASLIQLKDEKGNYIDKWMGVYHNGTTFVNYKTYLTFDEEGNEQWTTPVPYLSEYRSIESSHQICEVGMFRSPDGKRIVALARNQSHNGPATMFYSDDEGETWSKPVDLPGSLAGERHKAMYDPTDPTGQRLIVTFREICYDLNGNNEFNGGSDWVAGDWIAWVGTYDDIMNQEQGEYRILLCEDWAHNAKSGDTGYTGLVVQPDGTFIMDAYGHWDKDWWAEKHGSLSGYNVYNDLCYIKQAKFKLSDLDELVLPSMRDSLEEEIEKAIPLSEESRYSKRTWAVYQDALAKAQQVLDNSSSTQNECYAARDALKDARYSLLVAGTDERDDLDDEISNILNDKEKPSDASKYEKESWDKYQAALDEIKKIQSNPKSTKEELEEALNKLTTAIEGLKPAGSSGGDKPEPTPNPEPKPEPTPNPGPNPGPQPNPTPNPQPPFKEGVIVKSGNGRYQVVDEKRKTARLVEVINKKKTTLSVPATVKINGEICKVTEVGEKVMKGNSKLRKVVLGKYVATIGKQAFMNCKKLANVQLKGKDLKNIRPGAFKKTSAKLKVSAKKMNKKQKAKLLKALKKSGSSKKVKVK